MAATAITPTEITRAGVTEPAGTASDTSNGNSFANDGRVILRMKNENAGAQTVIVTTPGTVDGNAVADLTINLAASGSAGDIKYAGPWPPAVYGDVVTITGSHAQVLLTPMHLPNA